MAPERLLRRVRRIAREALSDNQWLLPLLGAVAGAALAVFFGKFGREPDPGSWTITVDRARDTLMGWLSIVFAALSIVLAMASVTAQNVVGRYSSRMLRIYVRRSSDRAVIGAFAMAASFIMVEQYQLRSYPADAPAPVAGVAISLGLLSFTGVMMIWYISTLVSWFRVDLSVRQITTTTLFAARAMERSHDDDVAFSGPMPGRPVPALAVPAPTSGFLAAVDTEGLLEYALTHDVDIVIDRPTGADVIRGETIGWVSGQPDSTQELGVDVVSEMVDVSEFRELGTNIGFGVVALADIAIMALSPAVNDPNTAVQVLEELGFLFPRLAEIESGPFGRTDSLGRHRVIVRSPSLGDHLAVATTQIVLYGKGDPAVVGALQRLVDILESLDLADHDRAAVVDLARRVDAAAAVWNE